MEAKNKLKFFISLGVLILIVFAILIVSGFYPIAFVGGKPITWHSFKSNSQAAYYYYKTASRIYGESSDDLTKPGNLQEINRAVLDKLIENEIISKGLKSIPGAKQIVKNKLDQALKQSANLKEAVNTLYGIGLDDFVKLILIPQARKEVLEGRLFLENSSNSNGFDEWLKKAKKDVKVLILLNDFKWDGEKVVLKK